MYILHELLDDELFHSVLMVDTVLMMMMMETSLLEHFA